MNPEIAFYAALMLLVVAALLVGGLASRQRTIARYDAELRLRVEQVADTQRKLLDAEKRRLATERRWLDERNEFLIVIGHELRTPIGLITGYLDMFANLMRDIDLASVLDGESAKNLKTFAEGAISGAARLRIMLRMFNAMNDRPRFEPLNLCDVVYGAINHPDLYAATRRTAEAVPINVDCASMLVQADRSMVETAVFELVRNGLKATKAGYVQVAVTQEDGDAVIAVEDNGRGVPLCDRERIWEAGHQNSDSHLWRNNEGSGYGLTAVLHVAKLHGGSAVLEWSEEGEGSRFVLRLPMD